MDWDQFRESGTKMIDYIIDYLETVSELPVSSTVSPRYLKPMLPPAAPNVGESCEKIMEDFRKFICPGLVHWQHPRFFSFWPTTCSHSSILGEMLAHTIACIDFWEFSSYGSELEITVLDWLGKLLNLPDAFLHHGKDSEGGGIMRYNSTECLLTSIICARQVAVRNIQIRRPSNLKSVITNSLVAYCSSECHSSIEKIAMICLVNLRILESDENFKLRGDTLVKAIKEDKSIGYTPFFVCLTMGTPAGVCDPLDEIGPICEKYNLSLTVHASYAGCAMICPEFKHYLKGIEYVTTFIVNPSNWLLVHLDCAVLYVRDLSLIKENDIIDKTMLNFNSIKTDVYHGGNRTSRSLIFWVVLRSYGVKGLQNNIRNHVQLANIFEDCVRKDGRFEILTSSFGIVCFRLKASEAINRKLLITINDSKKVFLSCYRMQKKKYVMRFIVCNEKVTEHDVRIGWETISECTDKVLQEGKGIPDLDDHTDEYLYGIP